MTDMDPVTAGIIRRLAAQVSALDRRVRDQARASQARDSSVEGGSQYVYDENGDIRAVVGQLEDGDYGVETYGGEAPAAPSRPLVATIPGGASVTWDGFDENGEQSWGQTFARVSVHLATFPGQAQDVETHIAATESRDGGTFTFPQPADVTTYVTLVAWTTSGERSAASEEVPVVGGVVPTGGPTAPPASSPVVAAAYPMTRALSVALTGDLEPGTTVLVEAAEDEAFTTVAASAEAPSRSIVVPGLEPRRNYWLRATASNELGTAATSPVAGPFFTLQIESLDVTDLSLTVRKFNTTRHQLY